MFRSLRRPCLALLLGFVAVGAARAADAPAKKDALPRVLILGDSISIGYTVPVRKELEGTAEVVRPNTNCQHTAFGLKNVKAWVGDGKWDVIHFNWGIWDCHMLDENGALVRDEANAPGKLRIRHTPDEYRKNLTEIVAILEGTGAQLVWASTTPVMRWTGERGKDIPTRNAVAAEIMTERQIAIDDLHAFVLPHVKEWQTGDQVHFNPTGNAALGKQVADSVRAALAKKKPAAKP